QGPGWRWIFYLNVPVAVLAALGALLLIAAKPASRTAGSFDLRGAVLVTGGMLLFIYTLVRAPDAGWSSTRTIAELVTAVVFLAAFVRNERRANNPLVPFSIFRIRGLAPANATQLLSFGGLYAMFFFLSLYMQNVLGYSPINTGLAYLPVTGGFMIAVALATPLMPRIGTKPVIVTGALVASGGIYLLSHVPVEGAFLADLLPGISAVAIGLGCVFTGVTTAATDGVASDKAGVASGLLNASMQFGGALGLAVLSAVATQRTNSILASGGASPLALTAGFQRAFLVGTGFVLAAAAIAATAANRRPGKSSAGATT
ncbi:MAG: MFS transporter, partial [Gaiellaceae bacterium]